MKEELLSVGIDLGTSTTQLVFSKLSVENMASGYTVPRMAITKKEIRYKSEIYFTPLIDQTKIDFEILHAEGAGHTFSMHADDDALVRKFALQIPASRFLVNTPGALGGIGATTNLFPALTLGCGAVGGSSSSNNIGPLDLINIKRVAFGTKELADIRGESGNMSGDGCSISPELVDSIVEKIMKELAS